MPEQRVNLGFPFGGVVRGVAFEDQPAGTTRVMQNMRARDHRYGNRRRGAQRPGLKRLLDDVTGSSMAVRALAISPIQTGAIDFTVGSSIGSDSFGGSSTPADVDIGADWTLYQGYWDPAFQSPNNYAITHPWTAASDIDGDASDEGPHEAGGGVKDLLDGDAASRLTIDTDNSGGDDSQQTWAWLFAPGSITGGLPTNYALEISFTTGSNVTTGGGRSDALVGLFVWGDKSTLDTGTGFTPSTAGSDDSLIVWVGRRGENNTVITGVGFNNEPRNFFGPQPEHTTLSSFSDDWKANNTYTLRLVMLGTVGRLYLKDVTGSGDFELLKIIQTRTDSTGQLDSTDLTTTNTDVGVFETAVGGGDATNPSFFDVIDDFDIKSVTTTAGGEGDVTIALGAGGDVSVGTEEGVVTDSTGVGVINDEQDMGVALGPGPAGDTDAHAYFTDGANYVRMKIADGVTETWTASAGSLPQNSDTLATAKHIVNYQNRALLFGLEGNEDNWFMSRKGAWRDFNYTPATFSVNQAVSGDTSDTGLLPEPITCIAPYAGELAIVSGESAVWRLTGDPGRGGRLASLASSTGVVGPFAWAVDHQGTLYYVALDGFYRVVGLTEPQKISEGRMDDFFESINPEDTIVRCGYSQRMDGCHIILQNRDMTASAEHLFWDRRRNAFLPDVFDSDVMITAMSAGNTRNADARGWAFVGTSKGKVLRFDPDTLNDDNQPIVAQFQSSQLSSGGDHRIILTRAITKLGADEDSCDLSVHATDEASDLDDSAARQTVTIASNKRIDRMLRRTRGGSAAVRMRNANKNERFSVERLIAAAEPADLVQPSVT